MFACRKLQKMHIRLLFRGDAKDSCSLEEMDTNAVDLLPTLQDINQFYI